MKLNRKRIALITLAVVIGIVSILHYRATVPFDTAQTFISHIHDKNFSEAKKMIVPADRSRLNKEYWDRLAATEFDKKASLSISYTSESLLHSVVVFWVDVPDGDSWRRDSSVMYYAEGRNVTIHEIDFGMTPR